MFFMIFIFTFWYIFAASSYNYLAWLSKHIYPNKPKNAHTKFSTLYMFILLLLFSLLIFLLVLVFIILLSFNVYMLNSYIVWRVEESRVIIKLSAKTTRLLGSISVTTWAEANSLHQYFFNIINYGFIYIGTNLA